MYDVCPHHKESIQFIFSTASDGKIKAWLYDNLGSRVDYDAPGRFCTTMAYSADGTRSITPYKDDIMCNCFSHDQILSWQLYCPGCSLVGPVKKVWAADSIYNDPNASSVSVLSNNLQFGGINVSLGSSEMGSAVGGVDSAQFMLQKGGMMAVGGGGGGGALGNGRFENWGDSGVVADHSQQNDASTDTDGKNQPTLIKRFDLLIDNGADVNSMDRWGRNMNVERR